MLMLATWMPFQSVAAWQMMNDSSFSQSTSADKLSSTSAVMKASCHTQDTGNQKSTVMSHHSMQCASCLPLCGGVPPISMVLKEFSRQSTAVLASTLPLYNDHVPAVVSPPPVTFIL
jgi:hypothetical protein